ncbi:MAG: FAD-dependent oxidoreductase [Pseudoclavibacter sp.]
MTEPTIAVVGGGIAGLATGVALRARGLDVVVYEQAPQLGDVGAGIQLTPNSVRLLDRLGLGDAVRRVAVPLSSRSMYFRADGTEIAPVLTTDSDGNPLFGIHRADLVEVLATALPDHVVRVNSRVVESQRSGDGVRLHFADGTEETADVVVAADGIHSLLRKAVTPPATPVNSGMVAYRGTLRADDVPTWPTDRFELWMGDGKHLLVFPLRGGQLINYVAFVPSGADQVESWSAAGDPADLVREFAGWNDRVVDLISRVRSTFWWGLYDREPLARWTDGNVVVIGDAAHPMLPHLGQGANQSVEDAFALAVLLEGASSSDVSGRLRAFEELRLPRTSAVQAGARANGMRYDSQSRYQDQALRDAELGAVRRFRLGLYDYDVEAAALSRVVHADR